MYFPFLSKRADQQLQRRKGGGSSSSGKSSSSSSSSGKSSSSSSKSSSSGSSSNGKSGTSRSVPISSGSGQSKSAASYGSGGGKVTTIASGQLFAGRSQGGGTRTQVFGNRQYGSGYPGLTGRGVQGRGFPFFFWPLVWVSIAGVSTNNYLHRSTEYGLPSNSSRPGGVMMTVAFPSPSLNSTFRVIADNSTIQSLITDIVANCSTPLGTNNTFVADTYNDTSESPKPEQAVEYYRASSVALTLDGYNNTSVLSDDEGTPDTPLPSPIDTTLLSCLNYTIGEAVPLIAGASAQYLGSFSICLVLLIQLLIRSLSSIF